MDIDKLIAEIREHDARATPGPWHPQRGAILVDLPGPIQYTWALAAYPKDVALIAHYRTAAPLLAAEVERLTAERATIVQALDDDCAPDIDGQQVKTMADRIGALLGRWQDEIRGALCARVPDPHRIDGGGCDSGDPLDLTLAEVAQAVNQLTDQADEQIAALTAERDAARRGAEELRAYLRGDAGSIGIADAALVADHDVRRNAGMVAALGEMRTDRDGLRRALAADKATP